MVIGGNGNMDWRDLIAWQQVQSAVYGPRGSVGVLPLVPQDSCRIYLALTLATGSSPPYGVTPNSQASYGMGIALGSILTGGIFQSAGQAINTNTVSSYADIPIVAGTGAIVYVAQWSASSGNSWPTSGIIDPLVMQYVVEPTAMNGPLTIELYPDRHGALCQVPLYVFDPVGDLSITATWVRMERNPCDYVPGTTSPRKSSGRKGACDPKHTLRKFTGLWNGSTALSRGRHVFSPPVGIQRPQVKPDVLPDQYQSGLD